MTEQDTDHTTTMTPAGVVGNHESEGDRPTRPVALVPIFENIPEELRNYPQWVLWRYRWQGNRWTKVLLQPDGSAAKSTDPDDIEKARATWSPFDYVETAYETGHFDGIGFVIAATDPFCGFDFDHCVDENRQITNPRVRECIVTLNSYTELSASGTGLHTIVRAKLPPGRRKLNGYECYDWGRYFTVTGIQLSGFGA